MQIRSPVSKIGSERGEKSLWCSGFIGMAPSTVATGLTFGTILYLCH